MFYENVIKRITYTSAMSCDRFSRIPDLIKNGSRCVISFKYRSSVIGRFVKFDDYEDLKSKNMARFCLDAHRVEGVPDSIQNSRIFNVEDFKTVTTTSYID